MFHLVIFLVFWWPASPPPPISGRSCEAVEWVKPSISALVEPIVRQQNLRCPFLVISGESKCYHNPSPPSFLLSLSSSSLSAIWISPRKMMQMCCLHAPPLSVALFCSFTGRCRLLCRSSPSPWPLWKIWLHCAGAWTGRLVVQRRTGWPGCGRFIRASAGGDLRLASG